MARGGLSSNPETRERQLAALQAGRRIAAERRAAGLPTKRRQARQSPAKNAGEAASRGSGKVVPGRYPEGAPSGGRQDPPENQHGQEPEDGGGPQLGRAGRVYARILGYDV